MKVAAVIAEYNPLHNGHIHLINNIKRELQNDYTIVIMSGDYVERGEPAAYSKEIRAKWALNAGADLVLLLPLPYALGSADLFAYGAVSLLNRLGIVDYLCFGSECGDILRLNECANILLEKGTIESKEIKELIKQGNTFAKARSIVFSEYADILDGSNNILALEYIMALKKLNSNIIPYTIKRSGAAYNSNEMNTSEFASATGIRNTIKSSVDKEYIPDILINNIDSIVSDNTINRINSFLPEYVIKDIKRNTFVSLNDFNDELFYALLLNKDNLDSFMDVSKDLSNRISKELIKFKNVEALIENTKTKNYTYARLARCFMHILLNIKHDQKYYKELISNISHIKVLGLNKEASCLLNIIKETSSINICTRIKDSFNEFNDATKDLFYAEAFASDLYDKKTGKPDNEFLKSLITI